MLRGLLLFEALNVVDPAIVQKSKTAANIGWNHSIDTPAKREHYLRHADAARARYERSCFRLGDTLYVKELVGCLTETVHG